MEAFDHKTQQCTDARHDTALGACFFPVELGNERLEGLGDKVDNCRGPQKIRARTK